MLASSCKAKIRRDPQVRDEDYADDEDEDYYEDEDYGMKGGKKVCLYQS